MLRRSFGVQRRCPDCLCSRPAQPGQTTHRSLLVAIYARRLVQLAHEALQDEKRRIPIPPLVLNEDGRRVDTMVESSKSTDMHVTEKDARS